VATCFIFTQHLNEEQCLCLLLDQQGQVEAPLALRPIHEARILQLDARTIMVVPAESSSLHEVELPLLGERKAREAIPYALEEQVAQNVTTLHFSFDNQHYQNNRYLVVVTDKQYLLDLFAKLDALELSFEIITLDWFALKENECCVTESGLLIRDNVFKGALNGDLAAIYLKNQEKQAQLFTFKDSNSLLSVTNATPIDALSCEWIAQRLLRSDLMNLCQGELQRDTRQHTVRYWYRGCAIMLGTLIGSILLINAFYLHSLKSKITDVDKKTAVIYRDFFPEAKQVISPRFRITQLLTSGLSNSDTSILWSLLDKLSHAYNGNLFTIEHFRFQNRVLSVTLVSNDFAALENLQQHLQKDKVNVAQSQASTRENKVIETLELSL
jgi:general secretion pathway protein L